jgi:peptide/nickel transport system ATP-binding protein
MSEAPLLEVEDLRIAFPARQGIFEAVRGVSFAMGRERLGIVGESRSG